MVKTCLCCGKSFEAKSNALRCSPCRKEVERQRKRERERRYRETNREAIRERRRLKSATASSSEKWLPVPDAPNYEISSTGKVRNRKTGKVLKPYTSKKGDNVIALSLKNHVRRVSVNNLLWLVHGTVKGRTTIAVPVVITKGNERRYFESSREAARFIAARECYTDKAVRYYFRYRRNEAYGWKINYQR